MIRQSCVPAHDRGDPLLRAAILCMTTEQIRASWVREQEYRRARNEPYFDRLVDAATSEVLAVVSA